MASAEPPAGATAWSASIGAATKQTTAKANSGARMTAVGLFIKIIFGRRSRFGAQKTRGGIDADRKTAFHNAAKFPYGQRPVAGQ